MFAAGALQRVHRVNFHPVRFWEAEVRQHIDFRLVYHLRNRRRAFFQLPGDLTLGGMGTFLIGLHEYLL